MCCAGPRARGARPFKVIASRGRPSPGRRRLQAVLDAVGRRWRVTASTYADALWHSDCARRSPRPITGTSTGCPSTTATIVITTRLVGIPLPARLSRRLRAWRAGCARGARLSSLSQHPLRAARSWSQSSSKSWRERALPAQSGTPSFEAGKACPASACPPGPANPTGTMKSTEADLAGSPSGAHAGEEFASSPGEIYLATSPAWGGGAAVARRSAWPWDHRRRPSSRSHYARPAGGSAGWWCRPTSSARSMTWRRNSMCVAARPVAGTSAPRRLRLPEPRTDRHHRALSADLTATS